MSSKEENNEEQSNGVGIEEDNDTPTPEATDGTIPVIVVDDTLEADQDVDEIPEEEEELDGIEEEDEEETACQGDEGQTEGEGGGGGGKQKMLLMKRTVDRLISFCLCPQMVIFFFS